eukprot:jgi/Bigna1/91367/estExt_fgenesh1_pg.C_980042
MVPARLLLLPVLLGLGFPSGLRTGMPSNLCSRNSGGIGQAHRARNPRRRPVSVRSKWGSVSVQKGEQNSFDVGIHSFVDEYRWDHFIFPVVYGTPCLFSILAVYVVLSNCLPLMTRRQMFFGIVGSGIALSLWRHRDGPPTFTDPNGILWTKSKGGEPLAVFKDERGRIYMIDKYGNLYYDTGDPESGFFIVERDGNMINLRIDQNGQVVRAPVGNVADLRSFKISSVSGVDPSNFGDLPNGGEITAFPEIFSEEKLDKLRAQVDQDVKDNPEFFRKRMKQKDSAAITVGKATAPILGELTLEDD